MSSVKHEVKALFSGRAVEWAGWYADRDQQTLEANNLITRQHLALELLKAAVPPPARVLDVGCATGEMAGLLLSQGYDVSGVDIAEPMVASARRRWSRARFEVGDGEHLPFDSHTFDAVVCLGVIEYQERDEGTLQEIRRVLRPNGHAVISTPNAASVLHALDRLTLSAEHAAGPVYRALRRRSREGTTEPAAALPRVRIRRYRAGRWRKTLRSAGLEPEAWICRGWGWYTSRLGAVAAWLAHRGRHLRRGVTHVLGERGTRRLHHALVSYPPLLWFGAEHIVRVRVAVPGGPLSGWTGGGSPPTG